MDNQFIKNSLLTSIISGLTLLVGINQVRAANLTLYNGTGTPSSQGQLISGAIQSSGLPTIISETVLGTGNGVKIDTDANNAEYSGYSNYNPLTSSFLNPQFPTLDQDLGYSIFFNASVDTTTDSDENRATFSITAIGKNNQGIELGFDSNRIFAQNNNFNRAETSNIFDTSANINYELRVQNNAYQLFANNTEILTGSLRTYNFNPLTSDPPLGTFNPYTIPNFIFFGDNTGQASGEFTLRNASVTTATISEKTPIIPLILFVGAIAIFKGNLKGKK